MSVEVKEIVIGTIKLAYNNHSKLIWHACIGCGKERWVGLIKGMPRSLKCNKCAGLFKNKGAANGLWKGDNASIYAGRNRARRLYPNNRPCELCGSLKVERHHKDGNTVNNASYNIIFVCRRCHMLIDGRWHIFVANYCERNNKSKGANNEISS